MDIKSFIPIYPQNDDEQLIVKLSHLKEYADLRLNVHEDKPDIPGVYMNHQELQARYFSLNTPYRKGVIWHGTGVGKSITASLIVERFKASLVDGKPRSRALILVRNKALIANLVNEIATIATADIYTPNLTKAQLSKLPNSPLEITQSEVSKKMTAAVAKTYEIVTYGKLLNANRYPSGPNGEATILEKYSNRVIVVDEVQNLREQAGKGENDKKYTQYQNLHKFLHIVQNCTILLLTATPIWDKVYDLPSIFNLLLSLDDQLPVLKSFVDQFFNSSGKFIPKQRLKLINLLRGMVSYVRPMTSSIMRKEIGVTSPWLKHVVIYPSAMSELQQEITLQISEKFHKSEHDIDDIVTEKKPLDSLYTKELDALNCIYPSFNTNGEVIGGVYGLEAFNNAMSKGKSSKISYNFDSNLSQFYARELGPIPGAIGELRFKNLRKYSAKFASIIELLLNPDTLNKKGFIYINSVRGTGGAISLALVLRLWGFRWITSDNENYEIKDITVENPGNFVLITSDDKTTSKAKDIKKMIAFWNRPDNIHGNFIRLIVGSEAISTGYTLKDTQELHIVQGGWNQSELEQAAGRVDRIGSHDQLPKDERLLNIYRHVSVQEYEVDEDDPNDVNLENEPTGWVKLPPNVSYPSGGTFSTKSTIDTYVYGVAEAKEILISQAHRLLKEISWDCSLTYKRNVLVNDVNGSRACDYTDCNYTCNNFPSSEIDKTNGRIFTIQKQGRLWNYDIDAATINNTNYNILYSQNKVLEYVDMVIELFRNYFILRFDRIVDLLSAHLEIPLLLKALSKIINSRILIRNGDYFPSYLKEVNDTYFLNDVTSLTPTSDYLSAFYSLRPMISERANLEDMIEILQIKSDKLLIENFAKNPSAELFNKLTYRSKIILMENIIQLRETGNSTPKFTSIIEQIMGSDIYEMSDGNLVHNLYNLEYDGVGYNVDSQTLEPNGKLRVFDVDSKVWENVDIDNESLYIKEIKEMKGKQKVKASEVLKDNIHDISFSYDKGGKFKIHDNRNNKTTPGIVCKTVPIPKIYAFIDHLEYLPSDDEISVKVKNKSKSDLIELIQDLEYYKKHYDESSLTFANNLEDMNKEKLRKVYTLLSMKKSSLCDLLEKFSKTQ